MIKDDEQNAKGLQREKNEPTGVPFNLYQIRKTDAKQLWVLDKSPPETPVRPGRFGLIPEDERGYRCVSK